MPYPAKLSESQILEAAVRLVDELGIDALSTRTLAERLHARAPSLYRYFPDKERLVRAVSEHFMAELAREVESCTTLAEMGRAYWAYALDHPNRYAVVVGRVPEDEDPPAEAKFQVSEPLHRLAANLTPDKPLVTGRVLWSYVHGAVSLRLNWPTRPGLDPEEAFLAGLEAFEQWLAAPSAEESKRT
jgi:AcrR family transcriptional regulator